MLGATGQVGSAVANLAKLWGCKVLGVGRGNAAKIDSAGDPTLSKAKALTDGIGPDVVVDTVGTPNSRRRRSRCSVSVGGTRSFRHPGVGTRRCRWIS